jgi:hypothetical protein
LRRWSRDSEELARHFGLRQRIARGALDQRMPVGATHLEECAGY